MKRLGKIIPLLCFLLVLPGFTKPIQTNGINETYSIPKVYQDENQRMIELKHIFELENNLTNITPKSAGGKSLYIPGYYQETDYYCGPASVQNVLVGLGYAYRSQSQIASDMGTNSSGTMVYRIAQYINQNTNQYWAYQSVYNSSSVYKDFGSSLLYGIDNNQHLIPNVDASQLDSRYPLGSGHYVVAYGYYWYFQGSTGGDKVYYFDVYKPYGGRKETTVSSMINAISTNNGYYIW